MHELHRILLEIKAELALVFGCVWMWIMPLVSPAALAEYREVLSFLTTFIVFALACYRAWRVLFGGDEPPNLDFGGGR